MFLGMISSCFDEFENFNLMYNICAGYIYAYYLYKSCLLLDKVNSYLVVVTRTNNL